MALIAATLCAVFGVEGAYCQPSSGTPAERPFDFAYEISPILARHGCAAAECHGSATGRGGFKLSLFAGDPMADYEAIRNKVTGRRLDFATPLQSLLLQKPTRQIKHGGGRLFRETDAPAQTLVNWIKQGAPYTTGLKQTLSEIRLTTEGDQVRVTALFHSDLGIEERNVTDLAVLESTNEQVARLGDSGRIEPVGPGETWILARFGHLNTRTPIRRPFSQPLTLASPSGSENPLDVAWLQRLNELGLDPAPAADPHTVARRLYLDLAGRPPGPTELRHFEALPPQERIPATVDRLLSTPGFSEVFAAHLADWLEIPAPGQEERNPAGRDAALRESMVDWIAEGSSLGEITRRILTERGPDRAWKRFTDPRDRAEYVGRSMLGLGIGCARCHNHPMDRWRQAEHLRFSAFFSDPRPAGDGAMMTGLFFLPGEGTPVEPALLPLGTGDAPRGASPEETVAWFVLQRARDQFSRNFANRIFGVLVGKPLVSAPDDHRISNPAIHEPVLRLLADFFETHGTDLRPLVRLIATSRLYALSSQPPGPDQLSGDPESQFLARRQARPLSGKQFKEAVDFVLGIATHRSPPPDSPLARQLHILNSGLLQEGLNQAGNQVAAIFDFEPEPRRQLEELFILILARPPASNEIDTFLPGLISARDSLAAGRDLAFALLASREFGSLR